MRLWQEFEQELIAAHKALLLEAHRATLVKIVHNV